ncbi:MAG: dihydroorotase [Chthonomonas sp.]|nr:dihydroorotase [Chthonomonas sp.]
MHLDLRIMGGTIVIGSKSLQADIGVLEGKIWQVGDLREATSEVTLDATHLHVLPGGIDTQVHFREPGLTHKEDLESGTRAAIMGGITTIFEMPNTDPTTTSEEALNEKLDLAYGRTWTDHAFFVGASKENVDELGHLENLPGTPGIKIFMGSSTGPLLVDDDEHLRRVLMSCRRRSPVHAEDEARLRERKAMRSPGEPHVREHPIRRDAEAARLATERILRLSAETGHPIHVLHVSTRDELPLLADAKRKGLNTTCEVTPQHLTLNADAYETLGTKVQMNPPIRSEVHRQGLWQAVKAGLFDVFGSDHAPHTTYEKSQPYPDSPSGIPGVQTMLPILLDWVHKGELPLNQLVRMLCENPAQIYNVHGKGRIEPGFDADLTVVDLDKEWIIENEWLQSHCGWSPFEGMNIHGRIEHVFLSGHHMVADGALIGRMIGRPVRFVEGH